MCVCVCVCGSSSSNSSSSSSSKCVCVCAKVTTRFFLLAYAVHCYTTLEDIAFGGLGTSLFDCILQTKSNVKSVK